MTPHNYKCFCGCTESYKHVDITAKARKIYTRDGTRHELEQVTSSTTTDNKRYCFRCNAEIGGRQ